MLNPFTPSEIAGTPQPFYGPETPQLFYGRHSELRELEASLPVGSVLIQGPVGIGKSSLLSRLMDLMTGFDSAHTGEQVTIVVDKETGNADQAARLVLDGMFAKITERERNQFKPPASTGASDVSFEMGVEMARNAQEGRHLAVLKELLEKDYKRRSTQKTEFLLIGIDEADKSAAAVARLIRSITTQLQQVGVRDVRFVVAGVSPLHQELLSEDSGVQRAFNRVLTLRPMSAGDADELMWDKLSQVIRQEEKKGNTLVVHQPVVDRMVELSGGHPHILQLLGSHLIQHEQGNPDGVLGLDDLVGALRRICYQDRGPVYASTLHRLENAGKLPSLQKLVGAGPDGLGIASAKYPTVIPRQLALDTIGEVDLQWLVERDILVPLSDLEYGLLDELLRVRIILDAARPEMRAQIEQRLLEEGRMVSFDELEQMANPHQPDHYRVE